MQKKRLPKAPAGKTKRLRIYPTDEQKKLLHSWMGIARWTYNKSVMAIKSDPTLEQSEKRLRGLFVTATAVQKMWEENPEDDFAWILAVPTYPRNKAVSEAVMAFQSNRAKQRKQKKSYKFEVKMRSRLRDPQQCISFDSADWGRSRGQYTQMFSRTAMKCCQSLPEQLHYEFKVIYVRVTRKFFLCLSEPIEPVYNLPLDPLIEPYHVIALDPGVRTFQTGFDEEGTAIEFGSKSDNRRIYKLCQHLDTLESRRCTKSTENPRKFLRSHRTRNNMKRACARMREKIRNLVDELHKKLSLWLCWNYNVVIIPEFQTARMARRSEHRCIGSRTARMMYNWAHYRFRERLIHKANEYRNCRIVVVREDYTSKTCGRCGNINKKLGGAEVYKCRAGMRLFSRA